MRSSLLKVSQNKNSCPYLSAQSIHLIFFAESLSHPNLPSSVRPITATELLPQLKCCFAYMHGGKDLHDAPIICLPHFPDLRNITEGNFNDVVLYLTSITRYGVTSNIIFLHFQMLTIFDIFFDFLIVN